MKTSPPLLPIMLLGLGLLGHWGSAHPQADRASAQSGDFCQQFHIDPTASMALATATIPPTQSCTTRMSRGFPIPDPICTPGAVNPTVTEDVLRNPNFRTACLRSHATTEHEKAATYGWYGVAHPAHNTGQNQICELDHLVSLELGGADTLENIWPQCGPPNVALRQRYFKQKDTVENYLARQVKRGRMNLSEAQKGIATDWTQYLADANAH